MALITKAFFISLPIAILMQAAVITFGFVVFGEEFHVPSVNVIGIFLGLFAFFQVKKYLERKQSPSQSK